MYLMYTAGRERGVFLAEMQSFIEKKNTPQKMTNSTRNLNQPKKIERREKNNKKKRKYSVKWIINSG